MIRPLFIITNIVISFTTLANDLTGEELPKCIAHRGNNKYFLENSIASVKSKAGEMNADGIEIDIRHTKDGLCNPHA